MHATAPIHAFARKHHFDSPRPRGGKPTTSPDPLHVVDQAIRFVVDVDLRLLYGMIVPIGIVFGLIIWTVLAASYWLVGVTVLVELSMLVLIVVKVMAMLAEPDGDERTSTGRSA